MSRLSLFLYSVLLYLVRLPMLLSFVWRSSSDPAYRKRFSERFAWQAVPPQAAGGIVLHAVSMGEVVAATPLIEQLLAQYPTLPLTVTCTTPTGSARIQAAFGERIYHCYLPFDTPGANRRFLHKLAPQLIILLETELWPNLIRQAKAAEIPVALVNARLSVKSARGYRRFHALIRPMLIQLSLILTQEQATARRFRALAQPCSEHELTQKIQVAGNLKFEMLSSTAQALQAQQLKQQWGARPVWVAGSTHAGEDEMLLQAFAKVLQHAPETLLILVPRHPARFKAVAQLIQETGLRFVQRSAQVDVSSDTQVLLGDTMGELMLWYQAADLVFIGGSLIEHGGHNPLEPMSVQKALQSGPHVFNFTKIFQWLSQADAVQFCDSVDELAQSTLHLIQHPAQRQLRAERGYQLYLEHSGATARVITQLARLLPQGGYRMLREQGRDIWYQPTQLQQGGFHAPSLSLFQPRSWLQLDAVVGQSKGRNTVWFVKSATEQWVLRHYYRGGLIGKFNKDKFLKVPLWQSRAMAEFRLLQQMRALNLPVPAPVAALFQPSGWTYSADIILQRIEGSQDLANRLRQQPCSAQQWQAIGQMIAKFHQAQIEHTDLNCHNILLDHAGQFWLIDFDKCARRDGEHWKAATLARLQRSLRKEARLAAAHTQSWYSQDEDFAQLLQGYHAELALHR